MTNSDDPEAGVGPPQDDVLSRLVAQCQVREALDAPDTLRSVKPRKSTRTTAEIVADIQGRG